MFCHFHKCLMQSGQSLKWIWAHSNGIIKNVPHIYTIGEKSVKGESWTHQKRVHGAIFAQETQLDSVVATI